MTSLPKFPAIVRADQGVCAFPIQGIKKHHSRMSGADKTVNQMVMQV
ncbi:hypothetical protein [Bacillus salipaludis]|nr:hypothetical protein [Bacillus salipaludis]